MVKKVIKFAKWIAGLLFVSSILSVVAYRFIPVYFTPLMFSRCFEQIVNGEKIKLYHHWISLEEMPPSMPVAVMASEDQRFLTHHGFDYKAIEQAAKSNLNGGKKLRGGSTIRNKRQRTCSCGRDGRGCARDWKRTSLSLSRLSGANSASWRCISTP